MIIYVYETYVTKARLSLKKLIINFLIFNIIFLGNKDSYKKMLFRKGKVR